MAKIRVLVVDDSVIVRRVVTEELVAQPDIEVVATAGSGKSAVEKLVDANPDLVILDIEMPEMDGLAALQIMRRTHPDTPIIMFSSLTTHGAAATLEALARGATDFFAKPAGPGGLDASRRVIREELVPAIRALCLKPASPRAKTSASFGSSRPVCDTTVADRLDVLAIGASTGGPNALTEIFSGLRSDFPLPILVVQHMPPMFTQMLAERLTRVSPIATVEAKSGMPLEPGRAYVAPGDFHLTVAREAGKFVLKVVQGLPENACRPAFDPLLRSIAITYGRNSLAVVLTGMGQDGLRGCEAIRTAGGQVLVQDEASSVVWGMPGNVARAGLATRIVPIASMASEINRLARLGRD